MNLEGKLSALEPKTAVIIGLVLGLVVYLLPDDRDVLKGAKASIQRDIATTQEDLRQIEVAMENNEKFEAQVRETATAYREILEYFPVQFSQPGFMIILGDEIQKTGGAPLAVTPKPPTRESEIYERYPFDVSMEATYANTMKWLSNLTKLPQVTSISSFRLSAVSADPRSPKLRFDGVVSAYRYIGNLGLSVGEESEGGEL